MLGIFYNLPEKVKHFNFFGEEIVIINIEFFLYLDFLVFKNRVYFIK